MIGYVEMVGVREIEKREWGGGDGKVGIALA